jgi:molybdopterin-containing oxidoreductase family iron-sulfur binding subunit
MKTIPPPCPEPETGPKHWRSLDQLAETPEFRRWVELEFPAGAGELTDPVSRRYFVKLMSASFMLAGVGLAGCRRPEERILPHSRLPEGYVHGVAQHYATAMPNRGSAVPLVVKSYDGRPVKIEGNAQHPDSNGGTDRFVQASLLDLYDPDRAQRFVRDQNTVPRAAALDFLTQLAQQLQGSQGQGLAFLTGRASGPSRDRVEKELRTRYPQARWFAHEPVDPDVHRAGASLACGAAVRPYYRWDAAKAILALDCDFIGSEEDTHLHIRRFAKGRKVKGPKDTMNRLYAVEGLMTLTGANADHRLRLAPSAVVAAGAHVALEVLRASPGAAGGVPAGLSDTLQKLAQPVAAHAKWLSECAKDLVAHKAAGLVVAGQTQPAAVHVLAHLINALLGSVGQSVVYLPTPAPEHAALKDLVADLNSGAVKTLVILSGNPAYDAPADLEFAAACRKATQVVRLGYFEDETAALCHWHLPAAHYLETWGDARTADGTVVAVQPLIEPLFGGVSELEVLARVGGFADTNPHAIVQKTIATLAGAAAGDAETTWRRFLHDGFLRNTAQKPVEVRFDWAAAAKAIAAAPVPTLPAADRLELAFHRSYAADDGRFNNNGWLQETPDPVTKLTWDNAVLMSPATAAALKVGAFDEERRGNKPAKGLFKNQVVQITLGNRQVTGPVWIQPGMADHVLGLALGYGRSKTGRIGRLQDGRSAGFNAYAVRPNSAPWFAPGAKVTPTADRYQLACTQEHGSMEGRPIIREANLKQFEAHPDFARNVDLDSPHHTGHIAKDAAGNAKAIYPRPKLDGLHQWGMSIDLNSCVGCNACALACQSENNVPIVGKAQVTKGREMSWIRLDRYYAGSVHDPQVAYQPMLCLHCENAPCESVCPVNATVHDEEGLNVMAYNRCVGTRYCSNNCPYKVRRFNYFDYSRRPLDKLYRDPFTSVSQNGWELKRWFFEPEKGTKPEDEWELSKLVRNPDVTVRMRGVMEKCTFCVQRIEQAKIGQKIKAGGSGDVRVPDGAFQTACQQACPAEAIVFGDLADPDSRVSQLKRQQRDYAVLGFLDTKPRTTYLARIRNPNPGMPDYLEYPLTLREYADLHGDPMQPSHGAGHGAAQPGTKGAH